MIADVAALRTLPERHYRAGLAEVVKHAAIADPRLFSFLENNAARVRRREAGVMERVVAVNCRIKARVVEADEREAGVRETLNFGHTLGHAVEMMAGYSSSLYHGEAVAIGMAAAARLSVSAGKCGAPDAERLVVLLERFGLPVAMRKPPRHGRAPVGARPRQKDAKGDAEIRPHGQDRQCDHGPGGGPLWVARGSGGARGAGGGRALASPGMPPPSR